MTEIIVVKNSFPPCHDPRIIKLNKFFANNKFNVKYFSWNSSKKYVKGNVYLVIFNKYIPNFNSDTLRALFGYTLLPLWWLFLIKKLIQTNYDLIHVINFQSIIPSLIVSKLKHKPIIYEVEDTWFDHVILPTFFRQLLLNIDLIIMKYCSAIILIDEQQKIEYNNIKNKNIEIIYDSAPDNEILNNKIYFDKFTLFYAGSLSKIRKLNIDKIVKSILDMKNIQLIIAGFGDLVDDIKQWSSMYPDKIKFLGELSYNNMLQYTKSSDLLFVSRDSSLPIHRYICGSKIFEAMMCKKPIIVNENTATAKIVWKENCGVIVDFNNLEEIKTHLLLLSTNTRLCNELGKNGRHAYDYKYSWSIMEKKLLTLYKKFIKD